MDVFFARMVMPRSRSRSLLSMTRSISRSLARKVPVCCSRRSTSVVLPWSTCAMMAILRISPRRACPGTMAPPGRNGIIAPRAGLRTRSSLDSEAGLRRGGAYGGAAQGRPRRLFLHQKLARGILEEIQLHDQEPQEHLLDVAVLVHVALKRRARLPFVRHPPLVENAVAPRRLPSFGAPGMEIAQEEPAPPPAAPRPPPPASHRARVES